MWLRTTTSTLPSSNGMASPGAQWKVTRSPKRARGPRQPRLVDVDAVRGGAGAGELVGDEAGRAADVDRPQPGQVVAAERVPQHRKDLGGLLAALVLVQHRGHLLGVGQLFLALGCHAAQPNRWSERLRHRHRPGVGGQQPVAAGVDPAAAGQQHVAER